MSLGAPRACPTSRNTPAPLLLAAKAPTSLEERPLVDAQPLPVSGNLSGASGILKKTEMELFAGTLAEAAAATARFERLQTRANARAYAASVMEKVGIAKRQREAETRRVHMRRRLPMPQAPAPARAAALATVPPSAPVSPPPPANTIEVVLTTGERLCIPADPPTLRMVLAALREQPPRQQTEL